MITHTSDNREIYYRTKGTGPELLFVHGGSGALFPELVEVLSPQYSCTSFSRLGWGRSTHLDRDTTVEEQVAAIGAVHNSVTSAPVWVFGYSSGGNFALAYAVAHPDRVKGLILVEPALYAIYPRKPREVARMQEAMPLFKQGQIEEGWDIGFQEAIFGVPLNSSVRWPPLPRTEANLEMMRSFGYDQPVVITECPELNQVTQPVLIIRGDQGPPVISTISDLLDGQLSNSKLIILEGQSHGMPFAAPELVAKRLTTFISECESRENP